jgi:NAD-dependent dihydropyrimidine dehydrogenase PreA subunit
VRGVGIGWAKTMTRTYDVAGMRDAIREALTSKEKGPKVLVAQSECQLNRQRRVKPLLAKAMKAGQRVVRERFGVDPDTCTGDHSCIRLSGCPSLTIKTNPDPLRQDPIAHVENSCVGCGVCGEVSHAAVLCPSFYKAQIIANPDRKDRTPPAAQRLGDRRGTEAPGAIDSGEGLLMAGHASASPSPCSALAAKAAACSPTGSSSWARITATSRRALRSPASHSAPARPSIISR